MSEANSKQNLELRDQCETFEVALTIRDRNGRPILGASEISVPIDAGDGVRLIDAYDVAMAIWSAMCRLSDGMADGIDVRRHLFDELQNDDLCRAAVEMHQEQFRKSRASDGEVRP